MRGPRRAPLITVVSMDRGTSRPWSRPDGGSSPGKPDVRHENAAAPAGSDKCKATQHPRWHTSNVTRSASSCGNQTDNQFHRYAWLKRPAGPQDCGLRPHGHAAQREAIEVGSRPAALDGVGEPSMVGRMRAARPVAAPLARPVSEESAVSDSAVAWRRDVDEAQKMYHTFYALTIIKRNRKVCSV